jgi:hypothetical protein
MCPGVKLTPIQTGDATRFSASRGPTGMDGLATGRRRQRMTRFRFQIAGPQLAALEAVSEATGITKAEHVRRAIDLYLAGLRSGQGSGAGDREGD